MKRSRGWGMGRVFRQKGTRKFSIEYSIRGPDGRRKRKIEATGTAKRSEALALLRLRNQQVDTGSFVAPALAKTVRLSTLEKLVMDDYQENRKRSGKTLKCSFGLLRKHFIGDPVASEITPQKIASFRSEMLKMNAHDRTTPYKPATINRSLSALLRGFRLARKLKMVTEVPWVELLDESDNVREGFVLADDFKRARDNLAEDIRDIASFLYNAGWRSGEAKSLKWSDVDLHGKAIRLRSANSKNKKPRVLPLRGELLEIIERAKSHRQKVAEETGVLSEFVFHRDGGKPIKAFLVAWKSAARAAGLGPSLIHDFRRSTVKNLNDAGVPQWTAMKITGHETPSIFNRYHIVTEDDLRNALDRRDAFLKEQPAEPSKVISIDRERAAR